MFDYDVEAQRSGQVLNELGLDSRAIRHILAEPAPFDPRGDAVEEE